MRFYWFISLNDILETLGDFKLQFFFSEHNIGIKDFQALEGKVSLQMHHESQVARSG